MQNARLSPQVVHYRYYIISNEIMLYMYRFTFICAGSLWHTCFLCLMWQDVNMFRISVYCQWRLSWKCWTVGSEFRIAICCEQHSKFWWWSIKDYRIWRECRRCEYITEYVITTVQRYLRHSSSCPLCLSVNLSIFTRIYTMCILWLIYNQWVSSLII